MSHVAGDAKLTQVLVEYLSNPPDIVKSPEASVINHWNQLENVGEMSAPDVAKLDL